eukprot:TRINITY_DN12405_c0_g1_i1.p1 TRINITY_DN12405_c0_g1~~TRINITY_DN12405_c0_g1_i1.p1  ORF type:complete len:223 (+),score=8.92 TRINITY_DN12405_c0_g1_i1:168-836(+)
MQEHSSQCDSNSRVAALEAWLSTQGVNFEQAGLRIGYSARIGGYGLFTTREFAAEQTLLSLPGRILITATTPWQEKTFATEFHRALRVTGLARSDLPSALPRWLYLIHARRYPDCTHHAFANACPQSYQGPLWWPEQSPELQAMAGTNLHGVLPLIRDDICNIHETLVRPLCEASPTHFPATVFNVDALLWARSLHKSRCFSWVASDASRVDFSSADRKSVV